MAKSFYPDELQDLPKSQKIKFTSLKMKPSRMTMKFILGYGAALQVVKTTKTGDFRILLN